MVTLIISIGIEKCYICDEYFGSLEISDHMKNCENEDKLQEDEKLAIVLNRKFLPYELINDLQMEAIAYVEKTSGVKSNSAYPNLVEKLKNFNYSSQTLDILLKYIALHAPIIIHFNPEKVLKFFISDTQYRNQFETGTSGGTLNRIARTDWENRIFNNIYNKAKDSERVKYGVLNIVNDPNGVYSCISYGDSYLVLNNETIRLRTTFASGDTSHIVELATCENYCHVLNTYSDEELKKIISISTRETFCDNSQHFEIYKEIQIHGPILFGRDISAMVLHHKYYSNPVVSEMATEFCNKNGFNLIWMDP